MYTLSVAFAKKHVTIAIQLAYTIIVLYLGRSRLYMVAQRASGLAQ